MRSLVLLRLRIQLSVPRFALVRRRRLGRGFEPSARVRGSSPGRRRWRGMSRGSLLSWLGMMPVLKIVWADRLGDFGETECRKQLVIRNGLAIRERASDQFHYDGYGRGRVEQVRFSCRGGQLWGWIPRGGGAVRLC